MDPDDPCYQCDHARREHAQDGCTGTWQGGPCPCSRFDEAEHWRGVGERQ